MTIKPTFITNNIFPDYDVFTHVDKSYLKIEGTHAKNVNIGKYIIEIYPLGKYNKQH